MNYIEYGTTDPIVIALQTIGIPRHLASFIISECPSCIILENDILVSFDDQMLKDAIDSAQFPDEYVELAELFNW